MYSINPRLPLAALMTVLLGSTGTVSASSVVVQCPGDLNGDAIPDPYEFLPSGQPDLGTPNPDYDPMVQCMHLSSGDGFSVMADGKVQYIFGFGDLTGIGDGTVANPDGSITIGTPNGDLADDVLPAGTLFAHWPAPVIAVDEGRKFYLSLTNVGMMIRPDLFDPHTVHFHGFPNASAVFDGLPESGISINQAATLTYFYQLAEPGTHMYHCHVEATEHMQMGMLGNLYVRAGQSREPNGKVLGTHIHFNGGDADAYPYGDWPNGAGDVDGGTPGVFDEGPHHKYAYNDGDGSTRYDVEFPLQLGGFDPQFHDDSWFVQPLPFALMFDTYPFINGRGYPDTVNPNPLPTPTDAENCGGSCNGGVQSQVESSLVTATAGQKILLRLSNLNITVDHTLISPSIPMTVVGIDSRELRTPDGSTPLHYKTNSVSLGGGMAADVIMDTTGVAPGEYYLYASNLQYLANADEDQVTGGMMTKIVIN